MKTYEPDDELVSLYVRLRHETLPIHPPAAAVELPDGSHELIAPCDPLGWQDTAPLPVVPVERTEPSLITIAAMVLIVLPGLVNAGYWLGVWVR